MNHLSQSETQKGHISKVSKKRAYHVQWSHSSKAHVKGRGYHPTKVVLREGQTFYKVSDSGLSLSVISTMVYGTCKRWKQIAKWNHLQHPYRIYVGQKLIIKDSIQVSKGEMDQRLLNLWRHRLVKREHNARTKWSQSSTHESKYEKGRVGHRTALMHRPVHKSSERGFSHFKVRNVLQESLISTEESPQTNPRWTQPRSRIANSP